LQYLQDEVRRDVLRKKVAEEERLEYLQKQLRESNRVLQAVLEDEKRTTTHALTEMESALAAEEVALTKETGQFEFVKEASQPAKVCY
jgi:hypothetical protein